jgi:hypothetical protein
MKTTAVILIMALSTIMIGLAAYQCGTHHQEPVPDQPLDFSDPQVKEMVGYMLSAPAPVVQNQQAITTPDTVQKPTTETKPTTTQCQGLTKAKARCKHQTTNKNGYCYQHQAQVPTR